MLDLSALNQVRRLIVLVDTLYEHKIRLVVLAAAPPTGVFPAGTTAVASSDAEAEAAGEFGLAGNQGDLIGDATYLRTWTRSSPSTAPSAASSKCSPGAPPIRKIVVYIT